MLAAACGISIGALVVPGFSVVGFETNICQSHEMNLEVLLKWDYDQYRQWPWL